MVFFCGTLSSFVRMAGIKIRPSPPVVRPARSSGAVYAKFDQERAPTKSQQPFVKPDDRDDDSESEAEPCRETYASDYDDAEEAAGGDSASDCTGSTFDDRGECSDDDSDVYDCEFFELPCPKYRTSLLKGRIGHQRPHMPYPSLMEEEYLDEG